MKRLGQIALASACLFSLVSCLDDGSSRTANARTAPASLQIAPVQPRLNGFPDFTATDTARTNVPELPELPTHGKGGFYQGVQPLDVQAATDAPAGSRPFSGARLDPRGIMPVEQLIYGGSYPESDAPGPYRLMIGDRVRISVTGHAEFSGIAEVEPDGVVKLPGTEEVVDAETLRTEELAAAIGKQLTPYLKNTPAVRVRVHDAVGGYYFIYGEVRNAGRFPIGQKPVRLSEAIFRANSTRLEGGKDATREDALKAETSGGAREKFSLPAYAKLENVNVITPHRTHPVRREYNVRSALLQGQTGEDPILQPGQIVFVNSTANKSVTSMFRTLIAPVVVASRGVY